MNSRSHLKSRPDAATVRSLLYVINRVAANESQHFVHIPNLLRRLVSRGWSVELVSERGGKGRAEIDGLPVTYLSREGRWSRLPRLVWTLLAARLTGNRLVFVRISRSSAFVSAVLGRLFGWKTLFWVSGNVQDFNIQQRGWRGRLDNMMLGFVLHLVDFLVTGPETMKAYYATYFRLSEEKIVVLYNDVETANRPRRSAVTPAVNATERVLMIHRFSPVRETMNWFPHILEVLARRRAAGHQVRLDVIGSGPELPDLKATASHLPDLVTFHGTLPNAALGPFYESADLFLMPSAREGFPRVCLEAMVHSLPVITTDAGGTRDIFGPLQQAFVIPVSDPILFARRVSELLDDPVLRQRLAAENRQEVERFSTEAVAAMYDERLSALMVR